MRSENRVIFFSKMTLRRDISIEYWKRVEVKGAGRLWVNLSAE